MLCVEQKMGTAIDLPLPICPHTGAKACIVHRCRSADTANESLRSRVHGCMHSYSGAPTGTVTQWRNSGPKLSSNVNGGESINWSECAMWQSRVSRTRFVCSEHAKWVHLTAVVFSGSHILLWHKHRQLLLYWVVCECDRAKEVSCLLFSFIPHFTCFFRYTLVLPHQHLSSPFSYPSECQVCARDTLLPSPVLWAIDNECVTFATI